MTTDQFERLSLDLNDDDGDDNLYLQKNMRNNQNDQYAFGDNDSSDLE